MKSTFFVAALAAVVQAESSGSGTDEPNWAEKIWNDATSAVTCAACEGLLGTLKSAAGLGQHALENILTDVCKLGKIEDDDVCEGIIQEQGTSAYYVLTHIDVGSHTSKTFCASITSLCEYPEVRPYNLTLPPRRPGTKRPEPSGQQPIRVAHISDTHVDQHYEVGANYFCSKPICCRSWDPEVDAPGNTSYPAGPWGNEQCDPPLRLEDSMVKAIAALDPTLTLYTGDIPAHDVWQANQTEVLLNFQSTYDNLGKLGLVYSALGNHDTAPINAFPFGKVPKSHTPQWAYDAIEREWSELVQNDGDASDFTSSYHEGSYAVNAQGGKLRIISYNSIYYYKYDFYAFQEPMEHDPNHQFAWLIKELDAAEKAGQRVWLISHIPSGHNDMLHDYSHSIDVIVNRYSATIAALFFGHTHTDQFQVSYTNYTTRTADTASAIGYVAGSMTPDAGSPTFRIYDVDPSTFAVLDYTVYTANINSTNSTEQEPAWTKYYSAKEAYGAQLEPPVTDPKAELTPAFWHHVTERFESDAALFQKWWARTTRDYNVTECVDSCQEEQICALRGGDAQFNCGSKPALSLPKRDGAVVQVAAKPPRPVCEDGGLPRVLSTLVRKTGGAGQLDQLLQERTAAYKA
ncbi:sphingomyelin phosphodiesterase [Aspergillus taichungensis]|uniref:Sphingomyelin phosphodiesterase n=1 Tax=Aspergillus taichungensis TaxID=482145 RepID=A0A2J5HN54_9EURO|nr:sphingomyelin phosphodiesterase [Aspergillus taichungensis]